MLTVNAFVAVTLVVGLVNGIAIAAFFGLTARVDAFYAALMIPALFVALCIDYMGKNFLPILAKARRESYQTASEVTSSVVTIISLFSVTVAVVLVLASRPLFGALLPGFDTEDVELVRQYFLIMAPALVLISATTFHEYVCQHDEEYSRIVAIKSALPLANFCAIVLAGPFIGEYALPIGYTAGHAIIFVLMMRRARYQYRPRIRVRPDWERQIFTNSAIVMSTGFIARSRSLIANYFASQLGSGAIAALALAYRLKEPLERTMFTGVRMLMFSRTARLAVDKNTREVARLYDFGLSATFLLLCPALWWIGLNSGEIVEVVFERGAFNASMTAVVALALIGYLPSVLFLGVNGLMSNAFYAMNRVAVPAAVMPIGTLVYLALAPLVYRPFGVFGLAFTTSVVAAVIFFLLMFFLSKRVPQINARTLLLRLAGYATVAGIAFVLPAVGTADMAIDGAFKAVISLIVGMLLYVSALFLLRDQTLTGLYEYVQRGRRGLASAGGTAP